MDFRVLAVGDVVGNPGLEQIRRNLRQMKRQYHADFAVVNGENAAVVGIYLLDAGIKLKLLYLTTRVQARLVKLSHDIGQSRHTHLGTHIFPDINLLLQRLVFYQLLHRYALIFRAIIGREVLESPLL